MCVDMESNSSCDSDYDVDSVVQIDLLNLSIDWSPDSKTIEGGEIVTMDFHI